MSFSWDETQHPLQSVWLHPLAGVAGSARRLARNEHLSLKAGLANNGRKSAHRNFTAAGGKNDIASGRITELLMTAPLRNKHNPFCVRICAASSELSRLGIHQAFPDEDFLYRSVIILNLILEMEFNGFLQIANGFLDGFTKA